MKLNFRRIAVYALGIALTCLLAFVAGDKFLSVYWPVAFWSLVALDLFRTKGEDLALADRFIGYLFVAPFIFPARALELLPVTSRR